MKEGCKANIYICEQLIAGVPSIAIGDNFWAEIDRLQGTTHKEFEARIRTLVATRFGADYLPPGFTSIPDWGLEFVWFPTQPPDSGWYDYDNWRGNILVRRINTDLTCRRYGASYWQVPGEWQTMPDTAYLEAITARFEEQKKKWDLP